MYEGGGESPQMGLIETPPLLSYGTGNVLGRDNRVSILLYGECDRARRRFSIPGL